LGHIKEQTIKGSIYSYIGVGLGFLISGLFLPRLLTTGENGLLKLLISYSALFAQFGTLGFTNATGRLFAFFRDKSKNHNGFLLLTVLVVLVGFALTMTIYYLLKDRIIERNLENAELFTTYIDFLIPLIFFTILFLIFDTYLVMLFQSVIGTFYKEFIQRILILGSIAAFYFGYLTFSGFVAAYVISNCLPGLILVLALIARGEFNPKPDWSLMDKPMIRALASMSFFGIIVGFSNIMVLNVDSIIVSRMLGIEATGIYAITFFFSTLIIIPSRSLKKISGTIMADAWKNGDMKTIGDVYRKSSINQLIFGVLIFIGLWGNIHNVFKILPQEYEAGKYVIFFLGITNLIEMTSGVGNSLLATSKYYRTTAFLNLLLVVMVVGFNIVFINLFGLTGAAIASTSSYLIYNAIRYIIIYRLFKMSPFALQHIYTLLLALAVYLLSVLIPVLHNFVLDIAVRSSVMAVAFGLGVYVLNLSKDINDTVDGVLKKWLR